MSRFARLLLAVAAATVLSTAHPAAVAAASSTMGIPVERIQTWLAEQLAVTPSGQRLIVLVHGSDLRSAHAAVTRGGLTPLRDLEQINVTIASGTPSQIRLAALQRGVTYVEGNQPIELHLDSSNDATRGSEAGVPLGRDGTAVDGTGVSVAVIDTGIDPTHPFFAAPDGSSVVVANLKNACGIVVSQPDNCFADVGPLVDTDTTAAGGHGTHVNGIVAGQPTELADGAQLGGAAPGARIVSLSMGAGLLIINAYLAQQWVLEHHTTPCGPEMPPADCPPIKVVNNSYGPAGGGEFDPRSAGAKLQRALVEQGVVTVWSNGNDDGEGADNRSNPMGQDPTPGVISVASYFDGNSGTRDGVLSAYSSRGHGERSQTWPDISAPGESITSACRPYLAICSTGNDPRTGAGPADVAAFNTISGTSMAAPHISGIVAQLFQADPAATPAEVEHALKSTAYRYADGAKYQAVGVYTSSYDKGTGLVDVAAAVTELTGSAVRAPTPLSESGTDDADAPQEGGPAVDNGDVRPAAADALSAASTSSLANSNARTGSDTAKGAASAGTRRAVELNDAVKAKVSPRTGGADEVLQDHATAPGPILEAAHLEQPSDADGSGPLVMVGAAVSVLLVGMVTLCLSLSRRNS